MAKKSGSSHNYSPDGWFLNFLFLAIIIAGIVSATVLAQRRAIVVNKAAQMVQNQQVDYTAPSDY